MLLGEMKFRNLFKIYIFCFSVFVVVCISLQSKNSITVPPRQWQSLSAFQTMLELSFNNSHHLSKYSTATSFTVLPVLSVELMNVFLICEIVGSKPVDMY